MSLNKVLTATATIIVLSGAMSAAAQTPTRMNQFNAWGSYSYTAGGSKVCYILSTPTKMEPASVDHGDIFFLISQKPGQGVSYEPQVVVGYPLKEGGRVTVDVDGKKFALFTKGESAWMENAAEEPQLVAALRAGKEMRVDAQSQRGTATHYVYSLSGVSAALKSINTCK
ncbi:invasion associated locus B family protein [Mangrovicella endophytica]|uniref:invasion associated locus B family protein n=1 Tax=Mangrovicella endophytica TaxID=2066697 RepID=UPI000C9E506D|nr:invasion associated locus B family protein [Mangrovicella endophytica]